MEWVETTGKSVADAIDSALDQLGVDEADAEYEVISEPKTGMFGRIKEEARIRARVRPTTPPSKDAGGSGANRRRRSNRDRPAGHRPANKASEMHTAEPVDEAAAEAGEQGAEVRKSRPRNRRKASGERAERQGASELTEDVPLERQSEVAIEFLEGLLEQGQIGSQIDSSIDSEEELIQIAVNGDNLGHLIGPKGTTLQSLQEITRTVVQRKTGARNGRIIVDVASYREKRRSALERFSQQVADEVLSTGSSRQLEAMGPADRKVVHDTINKIDGVATTSEGEEPRRYVVVRRES